MFLKAKTLDDLMNMVFATLNSLPFNVQTTRGKTNGGTSELIGVLLELENPRARLSRTETKGTLFSAIGETLWYLSKNNDLAFIEYYIKRYKDETEDGNTIYGGYGRRLFNYQEKFNQVNNVIELLKKRPSSRRAAIQLFSAEDLEGDHKEIPCTCTLQFVIRDNFLHMITYMRSNDAYLGLPHDIFSFTMLQEIIARALGVELGSYKHSVGSLHLYENNKDSVLQYLQEGFQSTTKPMPPMPIGDPFPNIETILKMEEKIRTEPNFSITIPKLDSFWRDVVILLQIFSALKQNNNQKMLELKESLSTTVYNTFIQKKLTN